MPYRTIDSVSKRINREKEKTVYSIKPSERSIKSLTLKLRIKKQHLQKIASAYLMLLMIFQSMAGVFIFVPKGNEAKGANLYFSDFFTGNTIDTSKWIIVDSSGTNVMQNDTLHVTGDSTWGTNGIKSVDVYDRSVSNVIIESDMTLADCVAPSASGGMGYGDMGYTTGDSYLVSYWSGFLRLHYSNGTSTSSVATTFSCTNNTPFHIKLIISQARGAQLYVNNSVTPNATLNQGVFTNKQIYLSSYAPSGVTYDNFVLYSLPTAPADLQANQENNQVSLTWTAPDDGGSPITDYVIEYQETGSGNFSVFNDGISTSTSATVTGLSNGKSYDFRVSATSGNGTGTVSDVISTRDLDSLLLDSFSGPAIDASKWIKADSSGSNVIQNNVLTVVGNSTYGGNGLRTISNYDRSLSNLVIESDMMLTDCVAASASGGIGYGDMNFTTGDSYLVSYWSGKLRLYYSDGITINKAITNFTCTNNVPFHIKLLILQTGGAQLYVNNSVTPNATLNQGVFTNKQIYLSSYAPSGVTYDNFVLYSLPTAPADLQANQENNQVSLTWTAPDDGGSPITDYVIEYQETGSGNFSVFNDGISTSTSATVTGLSNGKSYDFRVSATSGNGTGTVSEAISTMPINSLPVIPVASSASITGSATIGEILGGRYTFADYNGDDEGNSMFRWLKSDSVNGAYQAIPGATAGTYTLAEDDLGKYIKFEVTPISVVAPFEGVSVLSSATNQINSITYLNHIPSTGQSLSLGSDGSPALTTIQPYENKMLSGVSLVPLVENSVESISSSMANFITSKAAGNNCQIVVTRHGVGATTYSGLKKGTAPYANGISQVSSVNTAATGLGKSYRSIGVTVIHGENDHSVGTTALQYESYLKEWQKDYQTDIQALTGWSGIIPLFTDQMCSYTHYSSTTSGIPIAQLAASEDNPDKIYLVGPKYFLIYTDGVHLTNTSYRWLGEYYGKVIKKVAVDKEEWKPLSPKQIYRIGKDIYAKFNVPTAPIQFDTDLVLEKANYGFEYYDDSSSASISSVNIISPDTVKITLNTVPTGINQRLRYAYTGTAGSNAGANQSGSARGNLRDSDAIPSQYGNTLYNWAVQFDKPIVQDNDIPSPFLLSDLTGALTSDSTPTFYWNNSDDSISGLAKYQLYVDGVLKQDNISPISNSVSISDELSCGKHSWYVKAFDSAGNSIRSYDTLDLDVRCNIGLIPPAKPSIENVSVNISNSGSLSLINLPSTITQIAVSATEDFKNASWEYIKDITSFFSNYTNTDKLYIKLRTDTGAVSDTITYTPQTSNTDTTNHDTTNTLQDGDIVKTPDNPDIYVIKIQNNKKYKRLILSPYVFNSYQHLKWENIKTISEEQLNQYQTSNLVKEATDTIIYTLTPNGDQGQRKPFDITQTYDPDSIYTINKVDRDSYEWEE